MDVSLVAAPPELRARAEAIVEGHASGGVADVLPPGLAPGPGWPQPDDLVGFAVSARNRLVVVDGAVVGGMGAKGEPVDGVQEVGYGLVPAARGTGASDRALRLLCDELFADPAVTAVAADVLEANSPSWHLLERLGFVRSGEVTQGGHRRYTLRRS